MRKTITIKIKECSSVTLVLVIGIIGLTIVFNSGCTSKEENKVIEEKKLIVQDVIKMIDKWNAIDDWKEELKGNLFFKDFFTVELQDRFLRKDTKPFFFVTKIRDIEKIGDILYLGYFEIGSFLGVNIFFELLCNEAQLEKLISSPKSSLSPEIFGVIVEVRDVYSSRYSTKDLTEEIYHTNTELIPIVKGVCPDFRQYNLSIS